MNRGKAPVVASAVLRLELPFGIEGRGPCVRLGHLYDEGGGIKVGCLSDSLAGGVIAAATGQLAHSH